MSTDFHSNEELHRLIPEQRGRNLSVYERPTFTEYNTERLPRQRKMSSRQLKRQQRRMSQSVVVDNAAISANINRRRHSTIESATSVQQQVPSTSDSEQDVRNEVRFELGANEPPIIQINDVDQEDQNGVHQDQKEYKDRELSLKLDLRFFFMNPIEKFIARRQFPWKFMIQVLKIILVTAELCLFGEMRSSHVTFLDDSKRVFRHIFLQGWDDSRDLNVYPPVHVDFGVQLQSEFYVRLSYAVEKYFTINETAIGSYDFDYEGLLPYYYDENLRGKPTSIPDINLCIDHYKVGDTFPFNATYKYDTHIITECTTIGLKDLKNESEFIQQFLSERNMSINFDRYQLILFYSSTSYRYSNDVLMHIIQGENAMNKVRVSFKLRTIHLKNLQPFDTPDCLLFHVEVMFDNSAHNGYVLIGLEAEIDYIRECHGEILYASQTKTKKILFAILDCVVILICLISFMLCVRALYRGHLLWKRTRTFFDIAYDKKLDWNERSAFINSWYIMIIINDVFIILGTVFKLSVEYKLFDSGIFTATGILIGVGDLLVWIGVLRYLKFFAHYNILIKTLRKAMPNIIRFVVCAAFLYLGFLFCGWVVFGPYHYKFKTLMRSSECLFALLNGDDMFATFATISRESTIIYYFSKIYIYSFVSIFIYLVLSLFIAIIMDAYECIKDRYEPDERKSDLESFIRECSDTPRSGRFGHHAHSVFSFSDIQERVRHWWRQQYNSYTTI